MSSPSVVPLPRFPRTSAIGPDFTGASTAITSIKRTIKRIAQSSATVLITGETGTGKEVVAKNIHRISETRAMRPFVTVNCGAIPSELVESELFGHEKGSFTGAINRKTGKFEAADGGTLFLDEVGDLPLLAQVKLLRVLQEREFERVGGNGIIRVDIRIIAATNKDLQQAVMNKTFREDLYYRLNVVPVQLPPLRERKEDIPQLAAAFLKHYQTRDGRPDLRFANKVIGLLQDPDWPGNVRQLGNTIEGLVATCEGPEITGDDVRGALKIGRAILPETPPGLINRYRADGTLKSLSEIEGEAIQKTLQEQGGNQAVAARELQLSRTTLLGKMSKLNIPPKKSAKYLISSKSNAASQVMKRDLGSLATGVQSGDTLERVDPTPDAASTFHAAHG